MTLVDALSKAEPREIADLAAFLTSKYKIQTFNAGSGETADVEDSGIVTALSDWAALHGGKAS